MPTVNKVAAFDTTPATKTSTGKRGRPKGSKNANTIKREKTVSTGKRGRPKGSKNKITPIVEVIAEGFVWSCECGNTVTTEIRASDMTCTKHKTPKAMECNNRKGILK